MLTKKPGGALALTRPTFEPFEGPVSVSASGQNGD